MKERSLKEIEEKMDQHATQGNIGEVMDLVDEHGNTFDKMFYAVCEGNLLRIYDLEALGIDITEKQFLKAAIKHDQHDVLYHQVKKGVGLDDVIELAKDYDKGYIEQWAKFCKRNQMIRP
ncbi:hypothetical protein [Delftia acidovorans]|uniref:hypothetical protein n=1 Tax=Delftia acidovorans TaxID=80866 RepID=UPI00242F2768|nr:hypothetical protein [Delftia acidovorans]